MIELSELPNQPRNYGPSADMVARLLRWLLTCHLQKFTVRTLEDRTEEHGCSPVLASISELTERGLVIKVNLDSSKFGATVYRLHPRLKTAAYGLESQLWLDALTASISSESISNSDGPSPDDS